MEPTLTRFFLFLGSELLFIIAMALAVAPIGVLMMRSRKLNQAYSVLLAFPAAMVFYGFMSLFMRILTGNSHFTIFAVLAGASVSLTLAVELAWLIFGAHNVPWLGRSIWGKYEFSKLAPKIHGLLQTLSGLTLIVFPIYIGYGYFGELFGSPEWPGYVLRATLLVLMGMGLLAELPSSLYLMTCKNVMEGTRSRMFFAQIGNSMLLLLLLSLFIWSIGGGQTTIPLLGEYFVFAPALAYATLLYLLLIIVIPYLIGHHRSKHWIAQLEEQRETIVAALAKTLAHPNPDKVDAGLADMEQGIGNEIGALDATKPMQVAQEVAASRDDQKLVFRLALADSSKKDPRFIHRAKLTEILELLQDCRSELALKSGDDDKRKLLEGYGKLLAQMQDQTIADRGATPWGMIGITSLAGAALNPVLASIAKLFMAKLGLPE